MDLREGWKKLEPTRRLSIQREFQHCNPRIALLITAGSGAFGLNITAASILIQTAIWWNSSVKCFLSQWIYERVGTAETMKQKYLNIHKNPSYEELIVENKRLKARIRDLEFQIEMSCIVADIYWEGDEVDHQQQDAEDTQSVHVDAAASDARLVDIAPVVCEVGATAVPEEASGDAAKDLIDQQHRQVLCEEVDENEQCNGDETLQDRSAIVVPVLEDVRQLQPKDLTDTSVVAEPRSPGCEKDVGVIRLERSKCMLELRQGHGGRPFLCMASC
ncbi:hypothetical protein B7463_g12298, partial [Scytalidium lignicola]